MRVLVVGSGGREHALVWKLRQSRRVSEVICAPGNGGIGRDVRCFNVLPQDQAGIAGLARGQRVDCVVIGPEAPLAEGLVDFLHVEGIPVVGPRQAAARLESSKAFAKDFMVRHGIPTGICTIHTKAEEAFKYLESSEVHYPLVVKADGLAAGKGVIVAEDAVSARAAARRVMLEREFGSAGDRVLFEEFLEGMEASYIVFSDGTHVLPAVAARDHKAAFDNDLGPNTGGMGAYSVDNILSPELEREILNRIIMPAVDGMRGEGTPFQGILYAGLMLTTKGPKVLEFNVRMGDPEGQVILPRLGSDFGELCESLCSARLKSYRVEWNPGAAVCVVLASKGYPGSYQKGKIITGLEMGSEDRHVAVFHSGTARVGENMVTDGGRVLGVTALASDLASAVMSAYEAVNRIYFEGMHYRRDIGSKGLV